MLNKFLLLILGLSPIIGMFKMHTWISAPILAVILIFLTGAQSERPVWTWKCISNKCEKVLLPDDENPQSNEVCKILCDEFATVWPRPTGGLSRGNTLIPINIRGISTRLNTADDSTVADLLMKAEEIFNENLLKLYPANHTLGDWDLFDVYVIISDVSVTRVVMNVDESYKLIISSPDESGKVNASITAGTYFGARHGLETLSQLIVYDSVSEQLQILSEVTVTDSPAFHYRGIVVDTARSYVSVEAIKRTISGMAANKLNTLHLHLTDTHSFPFESKTYPLFAKYGAFSNRQLFTYDDIKMLDAFAQVNGIRLLPEIDIPAHVGEGWQWVHENATVCFKKEPYELYCKEPPCGQLNPGFEQIYEILGGLYKELRQLFPTDLFHMGGDEVTVNCWNTSDPVIDWMNSQGFERTEEGYIQMWGSYFHKKVYEQLLAANGGEKIPAILWTSSLTTKERIDKYLNTDDYILQVWTTSKDHTIKDLLQAGYKIILSNYDRLYLDCGFGAWVGNGNNNWCSPYIGWQKVYDNSPYEIVESFGLGDKEKALIIGEEAALWTEEADSLSIDSRLWPRAAAMAERVWSNPEDKWHTAEFRMINHRERMVIRGISCDAIQPLWCHQNEGHCEV